MEENHDTDGYTMNLSGPPLRCCTSINKFSTKSDTHTLSCIQEHSVNEIGAIIKDELILLPQARQVLAKITNGYSVKIISVFLHSVA